MPVINNKFRVIASIIAGAVMVGSFSPLSYWWLIFICPIILYISIVKRTAFDAFIISFGFGLSFFGFGVPWTFNSIHEFGHAPVVLSIFLAALLVIVLALFPALAAYMVARLRCNIEFNVMGALAFSALWVFFEWLRGWVFTGFPWLLLGHVHHSSPLQGVIPIFGSYGASWLTLIISCFTVVVVIGQFKQRIIAASLLVFVGVSLYISTYIKWTHAEDTVLEVALVQGNIPQEMKWDRKMHPYILKKYMKLSEKHFDTDIIVWPETAIPTYYTMVKENFVEEMKQISKEHGVEFLTGVFTADLNNGSVYNSVMALGKELSFYRKRHLVPFGEYIPLRGFASFLENYIQIPIADLANGEGAPLVKLNNFSVGTSICYEAVYGNEIIEAMPEAKLLINVSNDAWFGDSFAPHQHLEITRSRAIETGRYLLRATNTGISAIIAPDGTIVNKSAQFHEDVVRANIQPYFGKTPYSRWGNWGIITILSSIIFIICFYQWQILNKRT